MKPALMPFLALALVFSPSALASGSTTAAKPALVPRAPKATCFVRKDKQGNNPQDVCVSWLLGATLPEGGTSFSPEQAEGVVGNVGFNAHAYKQRCGDKSEIFAWLTTNPTDAYERFGRAIKLGMFNPLKTGERAFFTARDWSRKSTLFGTAYFVSDGVIVAMCQLR
jgi:hypothetical protein